MTDYVLVGGGAWARELLDWFDGSAALGGGRIVGFLQDGGATEGHVQLRVPCLGPVARDAIAAGTKLIMAVAVPQVKTAFAERFGDSARFATLVHPTALVSASARLGQGVVLSPFSLVSAGADVGDFVTVNVHASVGHDVVVGTATTLSSYVDLTGRVAVGNQSFWGSGARALPGVKVGARTTVGAGAVVVRGLPDDATVYAMPARRLQAESSANPG